MALVDLVRKLGEALIGVAAPATAGPCVSPAHFEALGKLMGDLPIGALVQLFEGRSTFDSGLEIAERGAEIVAAAFPPAAITAREVEFGLEALRFLLNAAGIGPKPFRIAPGENPIRGGFAGARGHI